MPEKLLTERLSLRLFNLDDLNAVYDLFSSPAHAIGDGPVQDREATLAWLQRRREVYDRDGLAWYGLWTQHNTFVGSCGTFVGNRCGNEPEIGYEIDVRHRRQGHATEAAALVTQAAQAAGHAKIWATIRPSNVASVRIAQGLGYVLVKRESDAKGALDYYVNAVSSPA